MKILLTLFTLIFAVALATSAQQTQSPVLVELFTSEGCSDCPPADALLQKLDQSQPVNGADIIVLSEHVDYWNHLGWADPYSSAASTERQRKYGERFQLNSVYTPQMVVNGEHEFVGSDQRQALSAISSSASPGIAIRVASAELNNHDLHLRVESGALPKGSRPAQVYVALLRAHATSQVSRGENAGRRLTHVAVVEELRELGPVSAASGFGQDEILHWSDDPGNLRIVAFVQEQGLGRILGAVSQSLKSK